MAVFLSNGLLGGGLRKEPVAEPSTSANPPSFVPTSLLNPSEEDPSTPTRHVEPLDANQIPPEPQASLLDTRTKTKSCAFLSNGLLSGAHPGDATQGPIPETFTRNTEITPASRSFVSNGLLSGVATFEAVQNQSPQTSTLSTETTLASRSFVSNGFLSGTTASTSSLRMNRDPQASSSTLRFNVQARTFSGKSVYIRKKSKLLMNQVSSVLHIVLPILTNGLPAYKPTFKSEDWKVARCSNS